MTVIALPGGWVALRSLTGHDESAVEADDLPAALDLLNRVLVQTPGAMVGAGGAGRLTCAARDRVLAALYRLVYGDMIASTVRCAVCDQPFDLSFSLDALTGAHAADDVRADAVFVTESGMHFRLITGEDELMVIGLVPMAARRALLQRCVQHAEPMDDDALDAVEAGMERAAPLLNVELSAACAECGREQRVAFDIQTYLLARLNNERARLMAEVHTLAMTYHWSLSDILSLTRGERRQYLALIDADARRAALRMSGGRRRMGA
jgi:hypothetical protein